MIICGMSELQETVAAQAYEEAAARIQEKSKAAREDHGPLPPWALGKMNCSCLNSPLSLCFPLDFLYQA